MHGLGSASRSAPRTGSSRRPARGRVSLSLVVAGVFVLALAWWWSGRESRRGEMAPTSPPTESARAGTQSPPPPMLETADAVADTREPLPAAVEAARGRSVLPPSDTQPPDPPEAVGEAGEAAEPAARASAIPALLPRSGLGPAGGDSEQRLALAKQVLARESASGETNLALRVLFELEPETGRAELFALLEGDDPHRQAVGAAATWAAARHEEVLSAEDLAAIYELGDRDTRIAAASVLRMRGDDSLMRAFETACAADLASEDPAARRDAVRGLSQCRSETARSLLIPLLAHEDEELRFEAVRALGDADAPTDELLDAIRPLQGDSSQRVARMAERFVRRAERLKTASPVRH